MVTLRKRIRIQGTARLSEAVVAEYDSDEEASLLDSKKAVEKVKRTDKQSLSVGDGKAVG